MVELLRTGYIRLVEVRVLHHFWLDDGATVFDALPADKQVERLRGYDVRQVLAIEPSPPTAAAIAGLCGVFRMTSLGWLVAVPDNATVPLETEFVFFVTVLDRAYADYTALTLRERRMVDVVDPADADIVHRYKANVPVLSNLTGAWRASGPGKRLFLSREYPADEGDGIEALVASGSTVRQLTGDPPDAPLRPLGAKSALPVYVHQADVPPIVPPPGSVGAPAAGIEMAPDTPPAVTAVIRLAPRRIDDDAFSFTAADGTPRTPSRVFEVHLRNRSTVWRYRDARTGSIAAVEPEPLPLTYFGNAGTKRKPSPLTIAAETDADNPSRITALVSDIYV